MQVIDRQLFTDTFQYFDKEIIVEIIDIFLNEYQERLNTIKTSIESLDHQNIKFHAHSMKGVVANFAAPSLQAVAKDIEEKGTQGKSDNLEEDYAKMEELTLVLVAELQELRSGYL